MTSSERDMLQELRAENARLKEENAKLKHALEGACAASALHQNSYLRAQVDEARDQARATEEKLVLVNEHVDRLEKENAVLRAENKALRAENSALRANVDALASRLARMEDKLEESETTLKYMKNVLEEQALADSALRKRLWPAGMKREL